MDEGKGIASKAKDKVGLKGDYFLQVWVNVAPDGWFFFDFRWVVTILGDRC